MWRVSRNGIRPSVFNKTATLRIVTTLGSPDTVTTQNRIQPPMLKSLIRYWNEHTQDLSALGFKFLQLFMVLLICWLLAKGIRQLIIQAHNRLNRIDPTLIPVITSMTTYGIFAVGILVALDMIGFNTASLLTLFGTAGLAIGLALKDTLTNIAAGFMLLALRPIRAGDYIETANVSGTVKQVGLFVTELEMGDGVYFSAPNSALWGVPIKNYNRNPKRMKDFLVAIAYENSVDEGLAVLRRVISEEPRFLKNPAPEVMVHSMAENGVNLQLRVWMNTSNYWPTVWDVNRKIRVAVEEAGLSIPYPQREIRLVYDGQNPPGFGSQPGVAAEPTPDSQQPPSPQPVA
jgi:small conductance mechanosensitive channel